MDFLVTYAWIIWLAVILVFVILEVITVDFTSLMLAVGSIGGLVASLFLSPFWLQIVIAAALSLLLLFAVRRPLRRALQRGGDRTKSNVDALIGLAGVVTTDFNGKANVVRLANGETWTAQREEPTQPELTESDHVVVTAINGSTAIVAPETRTAKK